MVGLLVGGIRRLAGWRSGLVVSKTIHRAYNCKEIVTANLLTMAGYDCGGW